jgi:uncharacterized protein (TIGR02597 family)
MLAPRPRPSACLAALLLLLSAAGGACAQDTAVSVPVGAFVRAAAAAGDTLVSVTLARPAVARATVASVAGGVITAAGTPGWTANAFVSSATHHVRALSGALRGHYFIVTANGSATLTVDAAGLDLGQLAAGDAVEVAPFWTLGTLFPAAAAGTAFVVSTSPLARQTEILMFDGGATGINRSASAIYYHFNGAWRRSGAAATTSFDHVVVFPDTYLVVRNKSAGTALTQVGRLQAGGLGTVLEALPGAAHDNFVALAHPLDVSLAASGLHLSGFRASTSPLAPTDQLLWFDPAGTGTNRSASAIYYYFNGAWRKRGVAATTDFGADTLRAGGGFIIRKAAGPGHAWSYATNL